MSSLRHQRPSPFLGSTSVYIDRDMRVSGLLFRLTPQDLQTLICLLTFCIDGLCVVSGRDVSRALNLSEKQGTERLRRLSVLRFHGKPVVIGEGIRRVGAGKFAKGRYRIAVLPGLRVRTKKWSDRCQTSEEACLPLPPDEAVTLSEGKPASVSPTGAARVPSDGSVVNNKRQQAESKGETVKRHRDGERGQFEDTDVGIFELLNKHGVIRSTALEMARNYPAERIKRQVEMLPYRGARDPAAMLVKAIREDWDAPLAYTAATEEKAIRRQREEAERMAEAERKAQQQRIEEAMSKLSYDELQDITSRAREAVRATLKGALHGNVPQSLVDAQVKKIINDEYLENG